MKKKWDHSNRRRTISSCHFANLCPLSLNQYLYGEEIKLHLIIRDRGTLSSGQWEKRVSFLRLRRRRSIDRRRNRGKAQRECTVRKRRQFTLWTGIVDAPCLPINNQRWQISMSIRTGLKGGREEERTKERNCRGEYKKMIIPISCYLFVVFHCPPAATESGRDGLLDK